MKPAKVVSTSVPATYVEKINRVNEVKLERPTQARRRILEVALAMFSSNGYDGVSTTQIAKASGVTQPLIHYHFKSKLALWKACVGKVFGWLQEEFIAPSKSLNADNFDQYIEDVTLKFVDFSASRPEFFRFITCEGACDSERTRWISRKYMKPLTKEFEMLLMGYVERGLVKDIPVEQLFSLLHGVAAQFYVLKPIIVHAWGVDPSLPRHSQRHKILVVNCIKHALIA